VGYVFLIDQNLKVRWAGCGPATAEEVDHLRKGTAVLMRRAALPATGSLRENGGMYPSVFGWVDF
jgi:hypothetical protein